MKLIRLPFFLSILLVFAVSPCHALFDSDVKKAKEFIEVGMNPQAIALLQKRITDKPTDGEAHFLLAQLFVSDGEYGKAEQRFKSAMMIDADYGYKIGGIYHDAGNKALAEGAYSRADSLYSTAVQYDPKLKKDVADALFKAGKNALGTDHKRDADQLLDKTVKYDGGYSQKVNDLYKEYARVMLERAKSKPKNQRKSYINEAKKYLSQSEIDAVFPPPHMKVVFEKQYTGIGFTGGVDGKGGIEVLCNKDGLRRSQKFYVYGQAEVFGGGKYKERSEFTNNMPTGDPDLCIGMRAPKGKVFHLIRKEMTSSY